MVNGNLTLSSRLFFLKNIFILKIMISDPVPVPVPGPIPIPKPDLVLDPFQFWFQISDLIPVQYLVIEIRIGGFNWLNQTG